VSILDTKIEFLKGVGPQRSLLLNKELSIFSFLDLLNFFPYRHVDRSRFYKINEILTFDLDLQVIGDIKKKQIVGFGRKKRLVVSLVDETGSVELTFFKRIKWIEKFIKNGEKYLIFGKPTKFNNKISFVHPELESLKDNIKKPSYALYPIYHSTEKLTGSGLNSKGISKLVLSLLSHLSNDIIENLSISLIKKYKLLGRSQSFQAIHFPQKLEQLNKAIFRFKFEELFFLQLSVLKQKKMRKFKSQSFVFKKVGPKFNIFYNNHLEFDLTNAQKRVMQEIRRDMSQGFQMNRLLQGDVGSGKTIIAIMSILLAHDNGYQSCLMAPTEILANQHFNSIMQFAKNIDLKVCLLTGKTKNNLKKQILGALKNQEIDLLIGTHALIEDSVRFSKLGLVVIDEQHKFGVSQRSKLWSNANILPHVLVMTATPIPRTLAMTAYGDLDLSVIDELPPNRKKVLTKHKYDRDVKEVYQFLYQELKNNKQIYIVYPLIEESKVLDYKNLNTGYENIKSIFEKKGFQISMLHGRLNKEEKALEMKKFLNKDTHIMVATTVIEVGVNIPNATVMVIQNAEKFGLSQLHQLRGRVGRGGDKSYCFLLTSNKLTHDAKTRLKAMVDSSDGFQIAEIDLKLRGPGDILGTRQSGLINLKISSLVKDYDILNFARKEAETILIDDLELLKDENMLIRNFFMTYHAKLLKWGSVS
tara:strand:- start:187 stop:2286 length:2100 start_codon:yes stop_codon:yes gene_type:complete